MKKKKGSSYILVLMVVTVLVILGASLLSATTSTYSLENMADNNKKLNLMAESGMEIALTQVKSKNGTTSPVTYTSIMGIKSADNFINCDVTFYKDMQYDTTTKSYVTALGKYTIESKADNSRDSKTIRAVISNRGAGVIPTDKLFYINGPVYSGNFAVENANGPVYANGDFNLNGGSHVNGQLIAKGNITIADGSASTNGVIGFSNITFGSGGAVNGDVLARGNVYFGGGTAVSGKLQCDGKLDMPQGTIGLNAVVQGNASFSGGGNKISGSLICYGLTTTAWGNAWNFVHSVVSPVAPYTPVDLSSYEAPLLPIIPVPSITEFPELYNPVTLNYNAVSGTYSINSSGKLTSSTFASVSWGKTITIDTSGSDISFLVDGINFSTGNQLNLKVTGPHNLYIYLKNSATFTENTQFIGMQDPAATSTKIYVIGDGTQGVILNNGELDANVYIPKGSIGASGGGSLYIFKGCCIVKSVNLGSHISASYLHPDITGTPLEVLGGLTYPTGPTSKNNWGVDNWYN